MITGALLFKKVLAYTFFSGPEIKNILCAVTLNLYSPTSLSVEILYVFSSISIISPRSHLLCFSLLNVSYLPGNNLLTSLLCAAQNKLKEIPTESRIDFIGTCFNCAVRYN